MYNLPENYFSREESNNYIDGHDSIQGVVYQPLVYKTAAELVRRTNARFIIDVGCGDGTKLFEIKSNNPNVKVILIDHEYIIDNVVKRQPDAIYYKADFESFMPELDESILKDAIVICSDVVEHLLKPEILLTFLSFCSRKAKGVVISTPDRVQERGLLDYGPPANPFHIREWSLDEFMRLLVDFNFPTQMLGGLTYSNDLSLTRATLICIFSRFFSDKNDNHININNLKSHKISGKDIKYNDVLSIIKKNRDVIFIDDVWYSLQPDKCHLLPLNLRVSVIDMVALADYNNFNLITGTNIAIQYDGNVHPKHGPVQDIYENGQNQSVALVKGALLNEIKKNKRAEIFQYPFNVIINNENKKQTLLQQFNSLFFTSFSPVQYGNWHENVTRTNYIVELSFGDSVRSDK